MRKRLSATLVLVSGIILAGCTGSSKDSSSDTSAVSIKDSSPENRNVSDAHKEGNTADDNSVEGMGNIPRQEASELTARFGYEGEPFILHLYENDTAAAIARHVGTSDWNLPSTRRWGILTIRKSL